MAEAAAPHYPATVHTAEAVTSANAAKLAADVLGGVTQQDGAGGSGLPAVVVLAQTSDAPAVVELLRALRAQTPTVRPRVWPTFVAGDPTQLADFDAAVDELGPGACDLVLMMTGTASSSEKAAALGAWLHVKMPAPPSVLGELPDIEGRICRYVAIGSGTVSPDTNTGSSEELEPIPPVDVDALTKAVRRALAESAGKAVSVTAANDSASALCAAAEDLDPVALLQAETNLANALADVGRQLSKSLTDSLGPIIEAQIDAPVESAADASGGDASDDAASATDQVAADDRTAAVSQLVLLASKGGLSKMMSRSRMASVAQSIAAAARRDVDAAVARAVAQVEYEVPDRINAAIAARQRRFEDQQAAVELADNQHLDSLWRGALINCRKAVALWPTVDTDGIKRSWGGSVPAPRHYVVGSEAALRALPDDDDALSVIDLRESATVVSPTGGASIDLREGNRSSSDRHATVLLAQYGLPLGAFRAS